MLIDKIKTDWTAARVARDIAKATLLGTLVGAIQSKEKTFSPARSLTDDEVVVQIKKLIDGATKTIGHLKAHSGSEDALAKAQAEIETLTVYMPQQLDEMAIEAFLRAKMAEGVTGMGPLMGALKAAHAGAYSAPLAVSIIKRIM
jgi:uncharacterized protein YqeY